MYVLNDPPRQIEPALIEQLSHAEPATIGHFRHHGFMAPEIRLLLPGYRRVAGTAVTVRSYAADTSIVHYALGQLRPGDFLVIDRSGDTRHAMCGGGVAFSAKAAGCVGIIIDGPATDIQELREYDMPVWARGLSTVTGKPQFTFGEFCTPIVAQSRCKRRRRKRCIVWPRASACRTSTAPTPELRRSCAPQSSKPSRHRQTTVRPGLALPRGW